MNILISKDVLFKYDIQFDKQLRSVGKCTQKLTFIFITSVCPFLVPIKNNLRFILVLVRGD